MRVATLGEYMLRLSPEGYLRLEQADRLCVHFGGGEANVAVALSVLGVDTAYATCLPANAMGDHAVNSLRRYGVDTSCVVRGGERIGLYYYEKGISERGGKVIYDRRHSAFAEMGADTLDVARLLSGADWFHITGITPALSPSARAVALRAMHLAREKGLTVSFDPNYRASLWSREEAAPVLRELTACTDVLITNMGQAADVYGLAGMDELATAQALQAQYHCRYVVLTDRVSRSARDNDYRAVMYHAGTLYRSRVHRIEVADRVGAGDAFAAGLIYGLGQGRDAQASLELATAAGALKHTVEGDQAIFTRAELEASAAGQGAGYIQR